MDPEGYEEEIDLVEEIDLLTNDYVGVEGVDEADEDLEDGNSKNLSKIIVVIVINSFYIINYIQDQLQLMMLQQQYAQEIPDVVKNFIIYFHRNILENNVYELHGIYENSFNRL